jgi:hypothetical protein
VASIDRSGHFAGLTLNAARKFSWFSLQDEWIVFVCFVNSEFRAMLEFSGGGGMNVYDKLWNPLFLDGQGWSVYVPMPVGHTIGKMARTRPLILEALKNGPWRTSAIREAVHAEYSAGVRSIGR